MERRHRWPLILLGTAAVLSTAVLAAWLTIPGSDELAARVAATAQARLGVKVSVGSVHWRLLPRPAVIIEKVATVQPQPISFDRMILRPQLAALLDRKLVLDQVDIEGGVVPQLTLRTLRIAPGEAAPSDGVPLARLRFRNVTWITRHGVPLEFDGSADFDPNWRPRSVSVVRPGVQPQAELTLEREGNQDRWQTKVRVGGGTADGQITLTAAKDGSLQLAGQLAPRDVEVESALAWFKRHSAIHGKAQGQTTLSATGDTITALARTLHTRTLFTMTNATVLHIDVDKAIRTAGQDRAGTTALQSLKGQMDTQNTPAGMVVRYSALEARGDTFSATGGGTIENRQVQGEVMVDLAGGLVGVPLKIAGSLDAPQVSVPASAIAGAAIGTAVLPGVGTAIGARVGAALGNLFGTGDAATARKPAPVVGR